MNRCLILALVFSCAAISYSQTPATPGADERRGSLMRSYFSAFGSQGQSSMERLNALSLAPESFPNLPLEEAINPDEYVLSAGDVLEVNIFGSVPITLRSMISPEGMLSLRTIGIFEAKGKSLTQLKKELEQAVTRQYKAPSFGLSLYQPRSFLVMVSGAVSQRGQHVATALDRVDKVFYLANAQGPPPPDAAQLAAS